MSTNGTATHHDPALRAHRRRFGLMDGDARKLSSALRTLREYDELLRATEILQPGDLLRVGAALKLLVDGPEGR